MAPKEPFKVHSLSKHIEATKKGMSADAQYNRRPANRAKATAKTSGSQAVDPNKLFANNDDSDDSDGSSSSSSSSGGGSSDEEGGSDFLRKLGASGAKPTPSKRRSKTDEIADSDVERKASTKSAAATNKAAPVKHESSDESDSESEAEETEAKVKANGAAVKQQSSSASGSDSESESESEDEGEEEKAKESSKAAAAKAESSSDATSSSESDSESEDEPEPKTADKAKPTVNGKPAHTTSSSDDSESEAEDNSKASKPTQKAAAEPANSSSDSEDSDEEMADESMHISDRVERRQHAVPNFVAPGFVLRKGEDGATADDVAKVFNKANLEGKQFWYFTVPSNVPISVVQNMEIPMDGAQSQSVFSHDGEDYGISFDSMQPKSNIQIMIPSADGSQYESMAPRRVNQIMQVKKIAQLGTLSQDASSAGPAAKRAPRPQPKGLKARYQPLGVDEPMGAIGESDSEGGQDAEMTEAPAVPSSSKSSKKEKKRKQKDDASQATTPKPAAKSQDVATPSTSRKGKRKLTVSEQDAIAAAEQLKEESKMAGTKSKKQKTDRTGSVDLGSEPPVSTKKQTPVVPPTVPQPYTISNLTVSTPSKPASTPAKKSKKSSKTDTLGPSDSQTAALPSSKKETPVPVPRQSVVPIPAVPHSSPSKAAPTPKTPAEKKTKKSKDKGAKKGTPA